LEANERADVAEAAELIESSEPTEPIDPIDAIDPTEPIERIEPRLRSTGSSHSSSRTSASPRLRLYRGASSATAYREREGFHRNVPSVLSSDAQRLRSLSSRFSRADDLRRGLALTERISLPVPVPMPIRLAVGVRGASGFLVGQARPETALAGGRHPGTYRRCVPARAARFNPRL
jgi:hypothetical protein